MTSPPLAGQELDPASTERLNGWLAQHLPGFRPPCQLEKFAAGQSNPTFLLRSDSGNFVLRRKPPGQLLASAHAVDREYRLLCALQHSAVPVATPYALCEDESVIGSMFYVMSYEKGDIFWDPALPEVSTAHRRDYYLALIKTLASLHDVDVASAGLADFGKAGNYYARQLARWSVQYQNSATENIPAMTALIRWLETHLPDDDGQNCLIHGDYRLDNVIFESRSPQVRAVLDWELATLGHPLADLAYYCMALRLPRKGSMRGLQGENLRALNIPDEKSIIENYCQLRGIPPVEHWEFYLAFSFFRLAAILQGVYRRGLNGNASSDKASTMGLLVKPLADMGLEIAQARHQGNRTTSRQR